MNQVASNGLEQLTLIEIEGPASSQEKAARKARSKDSTTVPSGIRMLFATADMFPQLGVMPQSRSAKEILLDSMRAAAGKVHSAPELPEEDNEGLDARVDVDEDLDDAPLFGPKCVLAVSDEDLAAEQRDWCSRWIPTEWQFAKMHSDCLDENFAFLLATDMKPRVWQEKGEILQWIFTVDEIDGKNVRDIPFSFVNCCIAAGYDPDVLRQMLLQLPLVRSLLVNLCLAKEEDLPPLQSHKYYSDYVGLENATPSHPVYQFAGVS